MTDLMRQWNEAVEEFDKWTHFEHDRATAHDIVFYKLRELPFTMAFELARLYHLIYVDSPAVKVGESR